MVDDVINIGITKVEGDNLARSEVDDKR